VNDGTSQTLPIANCRLPIEEDYTFYDVRRTTAEIKTNNWQLAIGNDSGLLC